MSRAGDDQRARRQVESARYMASGIRAEAVCRAAEAAARHQRESSYGAASRTRVGRDCWATGDGSFAASGDVLVDERGRRTNRADECALQVGHGASWDPAESAAISAGAEWPALSNRRKSLRASALTTAVLVAAGVR